MSARTESVAKYICEKANWSISNLELQKMLYLAQLFHMGRNKGEKLFKGHFEAWDYGPVCPEIYHKAKAFGSNHVKDIFSNALGFKNDDYRKTVMNDVCDKFLKYKAGDLVDITHWDNGAWSKHYIPKAKNIRIPNEDIWQEYNDRQEAAKKRKRPRRIQTQSA